jgi:hypothetical protein
MTETESKEEVTPDDLLSDFRGKSLFGIVFFTIVIHAALLLGTSVPFLYKTFVGEEKSNLTEKQRTEVAMREATASLRKIAEQHGLKPQDLSNQLGSAGTSRPKPPTKGTSKGPKTTSSSGGSTTTETPPDKPKSAIEKELELKAKGPELPAVPKDDEEDLFK